LVDVFDNMLLLYEDEDHDLLEPIPVRARQRPPVVPDRVDLSRKDAIVNLVDVYAGPGLAEVPREAVKSLRVIAYHYAFQNMADDSRAIGVDSSWDTVKIVLGTVPVHKDGSAMFRVPANTPITVQPLDAQGRSLQLMRSWMTAMPGETLSCVGCHAPANTVPPPRQTLAARHGPATIKPWYGPARGFSFRREVQPVLEKYCTGCHNGSMKSEKGQPLDFTERASSDPRGFSPSYLALHRFVRRPGAETDYHLLPAAEYHADVSELVQLLDKGHHNVQLDAEAWDRLITWIDLNVPFHGTWREAQGEGRVGEQRFRRRELRRLYAGLDEDPEEIIIPAKLGTTEQITPKPVIPETGPVVNLSGWPLTAAEAKRRQNSTGRAITKTVDLGDGVEMRLVYIPAGQFVMGDATGGSDERPRRVQIEKPFWIGQFEVTNREFAQFAPSHDSRYIRTHGITSTRGYPVNLPEQPVVRVSWNRANDFCRWLSDKTGENFSLPTETRWEYACRAGAATPFSYGGLDADFSTHANLADRQVEHLRDYSHNSTRAWLPRDSRYDDKAMVTVPVGGYQSNAWGLFDMHGNAAEWTGSNYSFTTVGREPRADDQRRVVRGGSWRDRPQRSRSAFRLGYPAWRKVYNVGFRVVCEDHQSSD
jgi:formylglycine-generating enzyme required for sulfatase activity